MYKKVKIRCIIRIYFIQEVNLLEDKFLDDSPCQENNLDHQVENQTYKKENFILIIDDDGMVESIKPKFDDIN